MDGRDICFPLSPARSATHTPTHSTLTCSNMTGTISPKGDIAMVNIVNGVYNTPWPKATVMRKAGKLR